MKHLAIIFSLIASPVLAAEGPKPTYEDLQKKVQVQGAKIADLQDQTANADAQAATYRDELLAAEDRLVACRAPEIMPQISQRLGFGAALSAPSGAGVKKNTSGNVRP